ncbi:hypothetical protein WN48_09220 [Eufriesea mexicana]|uniref:Uncharacterized protein n=1 Tax=Eufriesea mexicana TaxID=516756 RepID=A0A310SAQ0_9HYME|nr:hypothetical protein WN48_09220 [Eufriesea mexicana]
MCENIETVLIYHNEINTNILLDPKEIDRDLRTVNKIVSEIQTNCKECNSPSLGYLKDNLKKLNRDYMRLHSTLHKKMKRGILNIIGSVSKSLFGTLDEDSFNFKKEDNTIFEDQIESKHGGVTTADLNYRYD